MLPLAPFGRTGHDSSRVIFGGAALSRASEADAEALLPQLLDAGVNHLDVAASYGDAEVRVAPWLAAHPGRWFLATKTGERDGAGARASLERSLERMGVDHVDLIQLHNLVEEGEWQQAMGPGGALEALLAARDEGLCRFVGVTGHGLRIAAMHLRSLERHDFDSVLLPHNHALQADPGYRHDVEALRERCAAGGVAVQTIKSVARRRWRGGGDGAASWYEPLPAEEVGAIDRAVRFVLAEADLFLNSSSDARLLPATLASASAPGATTAPGGAELDDDARALGIEPLFDGASLERI